MLLIGSSVCILMFHVSSISSLFTARYANEVSRHTNLSNFGMVKVNRGLNSGNKLDATSVTKDANGAVTT